MPLGRPTAADIVEDFAAEQRSLERRQRDTLQLVEQLGRDKADLLKGIAAAFNILEDFDKEKSMLAETQRATINILEDFDRERTGMASGMTAVFNILDDFHGENLWLQEIPKAMLNLLEDLAEERAKAAASGAAIARAEVAEAHAAEIKQINEALLAANKELEGFSYSVSHDLRTPLRAIDGFSRILLEDYADKLDAEGQRVLNVVRDSTVKMARLIDDILAFSRAGRTEMSPTPVDIAALVRSILGDALAPALTGRQLAIDIGDLPPARGDRAMLERVWTNLLDNAIKFTEPKPPGHIEIGATPGNGEIVYHIRDNGIGFDMQYAGKLFGVFQRLHGTEIPGTGIGLAIVKRLITRHGGRVWAEGKVDEGATFYFALPNKETADV